MVADVFPSNTNSLSRPPYCARISGAQGAIEFCCLHGNILCMERLDGNNPKPPVICAMIRFFVGRLAAIVAALLLASITASSECSPSTQLQAKLRAHPTAENYAALGEYFGDKDQHECAAQAWASALKLQPSSAKFAYLLGLNLYAARQPEPAVPALQQSAHLNPNELQTHLLLATVL